MTLKISLAEYLADPCPEPSLSSGIAHMILSQSPYHAWANHPKLGNMVAREATNESDIGTIAHQILLEGTDANVVVVDAKDWRTKAAQEARDAAREQGKPAILAHKRKHLDAMLEEAHKAIRASEFAVAFEASPREETILWQQGETWCRARLDVNASATGVILDYKTTAMSAQPEAWAKSYLPGGGAMQAAHYRQAARSQGHPLLPKFVFIVQEQTPPYAVSFVGMDPAWQDLADRQWAAAFTLWASCLRSGKWPAYGTRTAWVSPPAWHLARWEEQEINLLELPA